MSDRPLKSWTRVPLIVDRRNAEPPLLEDLPSTPRTVLAQQSFRDVNTDIDPNRRSASLCRRLERQRGPSGEAAAIHSASSITCGSERPPPGRASAAPRPPPAPRLSQRYRVRGKTSAISPATPARQPPPTSPPAPPPPPRAAP